VVASRGAFILRAAKVSLAWDALPDNELLVTATVERGSIIVPG
jgi:hypothetical protein